jgi:lipopolysaccharide O-acetyltransferase
MLPRRIVGAEFIKLGDDTIIVGGGTIEVYGSLRGQRFAPQVNIGSGVRIGRNFFMSCIDSVSIGDGCLFSGDVFITDHAHGTRPGPVPPTIQPLEPGGAVSIGRHCFLGIRAAIMPGVTLGDFCVVGANAVVTRSFEAGSVLAGVPARLIRQLDVQEQNWSKKE